MEAVQLGASEQLDELQRIIDDAQTPTFENTFLALESSGQTLRRALMTYFSVISAHGTDELRVVQSEISSIWSKQEDAIYLNQSLYSRLQALDLSGLEGEDARLADQTLKNFQLAGAGLADTDKEKLKKLNAKLAELSTQFANLVLENQNAHAVHFEDAQELAGLSSQAIDSAAQAAKQAGHASGYLLTLVSPSQQPVLESLDSSESRRKVFNASLSRGTENNPTIHVAAEMAQLRAERAALLGFANHAETVLAQATAPSTVAVAERLAELTKAATANARKEAAVLSRVAGAEINAWDWKYFSNKVLRVEYSVDSEALRDYFELDSGAD